ncbi:hypothetical protein J4419_06250 [Candidatus Woesearchaeota archaeon]|nr:hypothetical protein [Candidatus Woesearchaeota archaeon]
MAKKEKKKKISSKKEKYAKFHKEKSGTMDLSMPELPPEAVKQSREDLERIERWLKTHRNPPTKEVSLRRMLSKR